MITGAVGLHKLHAALLYVMLLLRKPAVFGLMFSLKLLGTYVVRKKVTYPVLRSIRDPAYLRSLFNENFGLEQDGFD